MKHADLIRAALDGKKIQCRQMTGNGWGYYPTKWETFPDTRLAVADMAAEYGAFEYRLEPKPDEVKYFAQYRKKAFAYDSAVKAANCVYGRHYGPRRGITKQVYDGETGVLKSVQLLENGDLT
jgi:hypothetical protein